MSEADAEDGLHGLDEPLAIINDTRLNIEFAFHSDCFFLRRSPTEPRFRPFNFKKIPPRKRKSMERRNGARADTELVEVWSDCESHHAIGAYALV